MKVLVSDTSVLVDLDRGGLLELAFTCGLTMIVPDLLYERELENENGPYLRSLGLGVVNLTPHELQLVQEIRRNRNALSLPDSYALACAHRTDHVLVSGDKALRNEAKKRLGNVYGLLWILDRLAESGIVEHSALASALEIIRSHPTCRLPHNEVSTRIAAWTSHAK